jgi:hypothetical protein
VVRPHHEPDGADRHHGKDHTKITEDRLAAEGGYDLADDAEGRQDERGGGGRSKHCDDDVLVVQGASSMFNPLLTPEVIAAQRAADPEGAGAELDAELTSAHFSTTALLHSRFPHDLARIIHNADAVSLTDTSSPAK